jgi:hypothetical protein
MLPMSRVQRVIEEHTTNPMTLAVMRKSDDLLVVRLANCPGQNPLRRARQCGKKCCCSDRNEAREFAGEYGFG